MEVFITVKDKEYIRAVRGKSGKYTANPLNSDESKVEEKPVKRDLVSKLKFKHNEEYITFNREEVLKRFVLRSLSRIDGSDMREPLDSFQLSKDAQLLIGKFKVLVPAGWHILVTEKGMRCMSDEVMKSTYIRSKDSRNFHSEYYEGRGLHKIIGGTYLEK